MVVLRDLHIEYDKQCKYVKSAYRRLAYARPKLDQIFNEKNSVNMSNRLIVVYQQTRLDFFKRE